MRELLLAFRPAPGAAALVAARLAAAELAALPTWLAAWWILSEGPARAPWFTSGEMDAERMAHLGLALAPVLPWVALSLALGWLARALTDAAAVIVLAPGRGEPRVRRALAREAPAEVWTMLRVGANAALPLSLALWVVGEGAAVADRALDRAGATALVQVALLPGAAIAVALACAGLASAAATWAGALTLLDGRVRTRRSLLLAASAFRRIPAAPLLFLSVTAGARVAALALLVAWRQADPFTSGTTPLFLLLSLAGTGLQAVAWYGLTRGAVLAWGAPAMADLRARPDAPLGILRARAWGAGTSPPDPDPA